MANNDLIRVAVHGASGRVGREVLRAVDEAQDMTLVAAIDCVPPANLPPLPTNVPYFTDTRHAFGTAHADVVVDFSTASATVAMAEAAVVAGVSPVIGTTGLSDEQVRSLDSLCREHEVGGLIAPNFTIGAVLLGKLAALAAPYFDYVEIMEEHHEAKIDAPSGTALGVAKAIHEARPERFKRNVPEREPLAGTRGGDYEGVSIHSSRMPGRLAHHQVTFGGLGQTLTLRHDTINRECYMPGVLLAVRKVGALRGLVIGLDKVLNL